MEQLSPFVNIDDYLHALYTNNLFSVKEQKVCCKSRLLSGRCRAEHMSEKSH